MRNNKKIIKCVGLLIFILFTMEYLEPSVIGVRIGQPSSADQSSTKDQSSSIEKNVSLAPHAMIWSPLLLLDKDFPQHKFRSLPESLFIKYLSQEIFHPPLLSV